MELYSLVITVEILHEYAHIHTGYIHINLETNEIIILAYATAVWTPSDRCYLADGYLVLLRSLWQARGLWCLVLS